MEEWMKKLLEEVKEIRREFKLWRKERMSEERRRYRNNDDIRGEERKGKGREEIREEIKILSREERREEKEMQGKRGDMKERMERKKIKFWWNSEKESKMDRKEGKEEKGSMDKGKKDEGRKEEKQRRR